MKEEKKNDVYELLKITYKNKFSFLKEGLPSLKTACAPCMLGTPPNLVIFYTALKPRHRRTEHQQ